MCAAFNSQSFMSACVTSRMRILLKYQNMYITFKIQLSHLRSNFITLTFIEEFAAFTNVSPRGLTFTWWGCQSLCLT